MNKSEFKNNIRHYLKTFRKVRSCTIEVTAGVAKIRDVNDFYLSFKPSNQRNKDDLEKMKLLELSKIELNQAIKFLNESASLLEQKENFTFYYVSDLVNKTNKYFKNSILEYLSDIPEINHAYIEVTYSGFKISEINKANLRIDASFFRYETNFLTNNKESSLMEANLKQKTVHEIEIFLFSLWADRNEKELPDFNSSTAFYEKSVKNE